VYAAGQTLSIVFVRKGHILDKKMMFFRFIQKREKTEEKEEF